ncbi:hypothetical protein PCURB6_13000 [Paenibacillus curdlanolyticus]|nr:hypothetical protein PCURB6_13000 [Paenibacillus curdlanolyticus]
MAVTNTVYDSSPAEHDNKNKGILRNNNKRQNGQHEKLETFFAAALKKSREFDIYPSDDAEGKHGLASVPLRAA